MQATDRDTIESVKEKAEALRQRIVTLRENGSQESCDEAEHLEVRELKPLDDYLRENATMKAKPRNSRTKGIEQARKAVGRRLKTVIQKLDALPKLQRHLRDSIQLEAARPAYRPAVTPTWEIRLHKK